MSDPWYGDAMSHRHIDEQIQMEEADVKVLADSVVALRAVRAVYPDAVVDGGWRRFTITSNFAHADCNRFDPFGAHSADNLESAMDVLYVEVASPAGPVRVYSARRFNVVQAFERFGGGPGQYPSLGNAMRSTCDEVDVQAAYDAAHPKTKFPTEP